MSEQHFRQMMLAQAAQELPPALFRKYYARAQEFFAANAHLKRDINDIVIVVRWDESQHPRVPAGSPEGGQFGEGGGGGGGAALSPSAADKPVAGFSAGVSARGNTGAKQRINEWFSDSPFKGNIHAAMAAAPTAQHELGQVGNAISKSLGVEFKNPGVKTDTKRINEKVELRGGVEKVTDLARATFLVDTPEQADKIAAELGKHVEVAVEDWKVTPVNYADRALQIRFKNGLIGEVQILTPAMAKAKIEGHKLYMQQRSLDPVKNKAQYDSLGAQQRAIYGAVLDDYSPAWKAALGIGGK
jgi:hypothetical protein